MSRVVLVVDDEPLVLEITVAMLENIGCEAVTASNSHEALERLASDSRIEILITDINMPGMDGYELAKTATQIYERLKVIMLSGREHDGRGFPLIRKPFLQEELTRTMAKSSGLC